MDSTVFDLTMFLAATFAAALVAGLAGFAFGLVAAAVWLHILTPLQTASLMNDQSNIGFGPQRSCKLGDTAPVHFTMIATCGSG
jgi:hypothetical protein